ncbi:MAG: NADPH-dependent 7-cyano-7-deazaguanine reductase QueF [Myxococcota bacterium]|nr:NADPH-dependent 7-cyano-7-deazaguanine reductase QueF [Myxococcota bacterium]
MVDRNLPVQIPLGKQSPMPDRYDPALLCAIPRQRPPTRRWKYGADLWTCYELSWLDQEGRPQLAVLEFSLPAESDCLVESKSLKLYLNSLNQERFDEQSQLEACLSQDLSEALGCTPTITLHSPAGWREGRPRLAGRSIDTVTLPPGFKGSAIDALTDAPRGVHGEYQLTTALFRSLCPVTGQPDWGSVQISYRGAEISEGALLAYLLSFRTHRDFHEQCVERIFDELSVACAPEALTVFALYLRRGGIDINPFRSSEEQPPRARPILDRQ